jgi:catechol 2,3-dioxygenase-like lactoylglutathione lyase family enzyme
MVDIRRVDHAGIRIRNKGRSVSFYEQLGFVAETDTGFDPGPNVLQDIEVKHPGITHSALRVGSLDAFRAFLGEHDIPVTGAFEFGGLRALFVRDPDGTVIEFDERTDAPLEKPEENPSAYAEHP